MAEQLPKMPELAGNVSSGTNYSLLNISAMGLCREMAEEMFSERNFVVIVLYVPVALLALVANLLVIVVVIKFQYMRNVTNYFLVNLSVADLFVTIVCMPPAAWEAYTNIWLFDRVTCKLRNYLQCIAVASSVFTITAMAVDRYLAIARPFGFCRWFTKKSTVVIIVVMWVSSAVIFLPMTIVTDVYEICDRSVCIETWEIISDTLPRAVFGSITFCIMFALPGIIILWAYAMMGKRLCSVKPPFDDNNSISTQQSFRLVRERKRVAWILLMLVLVFAVCWLPYNTFALLKDFDLLFAKGEDSSFAIPQYMLLLGHANSALNPIIYCVMSKNFRKSVKQIVCRSSLIDSKKNHRLQVKWADSSASSQRLCMQRINAERPIHVQIHMTLSRLQSSQKTTKTCAV